MNITELKMKILQQTDSSDFVEQLREMLGVPYQVAYNRVNGKAKFTLSEAAILRTKLNMTDQEAVKIFLSGEENDS